MIDTTRADIMLFMVKEPKIDVSSKRNSDWLQMLLFINEECNYLFALMLSGQVKSVVEDENRAGLTDGGGE